jgi:hypothetical protein
MQIWQPISHSMTLASAINTTGNELEDLRIVVLPLIFFFSRGRGDKSKQASQAAKSQIGAAKYEQSILTFGRAVMHSCLSRLSVKKKKEANRTSTIQGVQS